MVKSRFYPILIGISFEFEFEKSFLQIILGIIQKVRTLSGGEGLSLRVRVKNVRLLFL